MLFDNKRSELEIMGQLLDLAQEDIKKTALMYKTNLCYNHFIRYFEFLLKKKFLGVKKSNPTGNIYYTTQKGEKFLESIKNVLDQMK
jgi:predicted transcriptional regulator